MRIHHAAVIRMGSDQMLFVDCVLFCLLLRFAVDAPADIRAIMEEWGQR